MSDDPAVGFEALAGQLGLGALTTSNGRLVSANSAFCDLLGYSEMDIRALPSMTALLTPESRSLLPGLQAQASTDPNTSREVTLVDSRGREIPALLGMALAPSSGPGVDATVLVRDLRTERDAAQKLLQMVTLVDRLGMGVIVWDGRNVVDPLQLRLVFANSDACTSLQLDLAAVTGEPMERVFPSPDLGNATNLLALCGTDRREQFGETTVEVGDSHLVYRWHGLGLPNGSVAAVFEDVTVQRAVRSRRQDLLHRVVAIGDEERRRLAMDLHDDAIQQIAAAAVLVEGLQRHPDNPQLPDRLDTTAKALRTALVGLRRLVFGLTPTELLESGLESAVRSAADYLFADTSTAFEMSADGLGSDLAAEIETTAFRITAEALTNVAKHADAAHVFVDVSVRSNELCVTVVDDGVGMQAGEVSPGHIGLRNMQDRAAAQGGTCSISSAGPGSGTTVSVVLPTSQVTAPPPTGPSTTHAADSETVELGLQLEASIAATKEARLVTWQTESQLKAVMEMIDALSTPDATVSSLTKTSVELLGRSLRAACAIHLLSDDRELLLRSASWDASPAQLAGLDSVAFADRPADTTHARTVLAGGGAVLTDLSAASDAVRRAAIDLPHTPHSAIVAALSVNGSSLGTVTVVRSDEPDAFTAEDVEFVEFAARQIGAAVQRATHSADPRS